MASAFTGALRITSLDADCRIWRLDEPLIYEVDRLGSGKVITVPAGFVTDGASIPRLLQGVLPAWGRWSRAAVIHDYLCRTLELEGVRADICGRQQRQDRAALRARADEIFHEACIVSGVSRPLAYVMWLAVRAASRWPALREASAV